MNKSARLGGVDEAGRGALAGPVVAAAVVMAPETAGQLYSKTLSELTDSKQLSAVRREFFFQILTSEDGVEIGIGIVENTEIDRVNILNATHLAMKQSVENLPYGLPRHVFVDGLPVRGLPCDSTAIVKGDDKSFLIAAASIIAKVTRDRIMADMDTRFPQYGFAKHKGYSTSGHLKALCEYGACPIHRTTYAPVASAAQQTFF